MRARSRAIAVLAVTLVAWAFLATPAQAHALLVSSDPPDGSVLPMAPSSVQLWFNEDVAPELSSATLVDARGRSIHTAAVQHDPDDPRHLSLELPQLGAGAYGVLWQVLAQDDGHTTTGVIVFSVGASSPTLTNLPAAASASPFDPALHGLRICLLALIVGGLGMVVLVLGNTTGTVDEQVGRSIAEARRRILIMVIAAAGVAVEVAVAALIIRAHELGGSRWSDAFARLISSTRIGHLWLVHEVLLIGTALIALSMLRRTGVGSREPGDGLRSLAVASVFGLVTIEALGSHAAAGGGSTGSVIAASLHILTALLWIGALPALVVILGPVAEGPSGRRRLVRACRGSFSRMAAASVLVIVVTGLYGAGREVITVRDLVGTTYGRILLVKVGLLLVVGAVGLINAARLHGWDPSWLGPARGVIAGRPPSRRWIAAEAAIGAIILLAAGLLADTPPALRNATRTTPAATQSVYGHVQDLVVSVSVTPNRPGVNGFTVVVASSRRPPPAPVDDVSIAVSRGGSPGMLVVPLQEVQAGRYFGSANLSAPGSWELLAAVSRGGDRLSIPMGWRLAPRASAVSVAPQGRRLAPIANALAAGVLVLVVIGAAVVSRRRRKGGAAPVPTQLSDGETFDGIEQTKEKVPT